MSTRKVAKKAGSTKAKAVTPQELRQRMNDARKARSKVAKKKADDLRSPENTVLPQECAYVDAAQGVELTADGVVLEASFRIRYPFNSKGTDINRNWLTDLPTDAPETWTHTVPVLRADGTPTGKTRIEPTAEARPYVLTFDRTLTGLPDVSGVNVRRPEGFKGQTGVDYIGQPALESEDYVGPVFSKTLASNAQAVIDAAMAAYLEQHAERAADA